MYYIYILSYMEVGSGKKRLQSEYMELKWRAKPKNIFTHIYTLTKSLHMQRSNRTSTTKAKKKYDANTHHKGQCDKIN